TSAAEQLFVFNYAREARPSQRDCLLSALRAAARDDSLHTKNRLESRACDGTILASMRLGGTYHPTASVVATLGGRTTGLVNFTSGYQVSEVLYQELVRPRLEPGESLWPAASDRVYGSFRGILAVDPQEGEILWERRLGVISRWAVVSDLDRDGLKEIVLSSYSPTNGISASGTTDLWCAYTLCLDASGHEIWRYRFCGPYAGMAVAAGDVVGDGRLEVIGTCGSSSVEDAGCLVVLSHEGETIAEVTEWGGMKGLVLADLTGDGREEIVSGGSCGRLLVLDGNLNVVASYTEPAHEGYESIRMRPLAANDLDGDGRTEIIAISFGWTMYDWKPKIAEGRVDEDPLAYLVVLDERLQEEARVLIPPVGGLRVVGSRNPGRETCLVVDLDGDGRNEILLCGLGAACVFEVVAEDD
ncbi:VCBS repeat-containing protein, partial [bacterium]|nr:VCBS repeat-containing protein [bacterium]